MILLIITEIRLVIHAIDHQSIQKITDLHVSVPVSYTHLQS